jgi:isoleucyl-tRNA synthetase
MFDEDGMTDVQRKFFGTLVNTYAFFALYANIDGVTCTEPEVPPDKRPEIDRWILSELNSLKKSYLSRMDSYDITKAARGVSDFTIDKLSNWYVRRNRRRFWSARSQQGRSATDKLAAYQTLFECLLTVSKLMAPFAPFLAEELFRNLNGVSHRDPVDSVHLVLLPAVDDSRIDRDLELRMERAEQVVMLVRAMRTRSNLKVRQPLKRIIIPVSSAKERALLEQVQEIILDEVNVKQVEYVTDESGLVNKKAKANFKSIGPKFGKSVQEVAKRIAGLTGEEIRTIEQTGSLEVRGGDRPYRIERDDVEILREDIPGWLVESDGTTTVALDTELTDDLIAEGIAREFVNRVQSLRKEAGFEVTDRINLGFSATESVRNRINSQAEYIRSETLAVGFADEPLDDGYRTTVDIGGEQVTIVVERITSKEKTWQV